MSFPKEKEWNVVFIVLMFGSDFNIPEVVFPKNGCCVLCLKCVLMAIGRDKQFATDSDAPEGSTFEWEATQL